MATPNHIKFSLIVLNIISVLESVKFKSEFKRFAKVTHTHSNSVNMLFVPKLYRLNKWGGGKNQKVQNTQGASICWGVQITIT